MYEFLEMCGFDEGQRVAQLPRVQQVFARLGLTDEDVERAKSRLTTYYDIELQGVRKLMSLIVKNLCNIVLMREDGRAKIVHSCMSPGMDILGSALMDNYDTAGWIDPNFTFMVIMGCLFDKYTPILEAAERQWLKSGAVAHCGMVKSRVGLIGLGFIPRADLTVTTGFACETSPKVNELIEEVYGIPACYVDTCQDRELGEHPDSSRVIALAAKSMRAAVDRVEEATGCRITDEMLWEVIEARKALDASRSRLNEVIRHSDPLPLRSTHLNLLGVALGGIHFKKEEVGEAVDALDTLHDELVERRERGVGVTPKGAPRVLVMFPHHHTDPRWENLANQMGLAVLACDFDGVPPAPVADGGAVRPSDPFEVIAQHLNGSFTQPLGVRVKMVLDMCRHLGVDGVLYHYHLGCRYVVGDALIVRDAIIRELGIPVLMIEWENFDPRSYNHEQYEAKLETFRSLMDGPAESV
jgi:benzoyl-CoA reductase/2-hydroxyglutaryl-CoA dehydratase subunit BcrC/BadD/HgdB